MYELLKQLKEVGFPQVGDNWESDGSEKKCYSEYKLLENGLMGYESVYEPTTDELIEKLGDNLGRIYRRDAERWVVTEPLKFMVSDGKGGEVEEETKNFYGTSLKEALIHMYISLHSK